MKEVVFRPGFLKNWKRFEKKRYSKQELLSIIQMLKMMNIFQLNIEIML